MIGTSSHPSDDHGTDGKGTPSPSPDRSRTHLRLLLVLTFATGILDAVGYLGLGRVFTANMTGNVVILGMSLSDADGMRPAGPLVALAGFALGAVLAGRALGGSSSVWSGAVTACLGCVALIVVTTGAVLAWWNPSARPVMLGATGTLSLAMGAQAATARSLGVKDVTTVVITSTLTGLAMDSPLAGGTGARWPRRVLAILLMLAGAAAGALLVRTHVGIGLLVAGAICAAVAIVGHVRCRA